MNGIIARLWRGKLDLGELSGKDSEETERVSCQLEILEAQLEERLKEEDKAIFQQYCKVAETLSALMQEQAFCDGYYLGTRIMVEAMNATKE